MDSQSLQEEYNLYIRDAYFRNNFQHLLTRTFLDWWFEVMPHPDDLDIPEPDYYERMEFMLMGWVGKNKSMKDMKRWLKQKEEFRDYDS